jgi:hypothetical protein
MDTNEQPEPPGCLKCLSVLTGLIYFAWQVWTYFHR